MPRKLLDTTFEDIHALMSDFLPRITDRNKIKVVFDKLEHLLRQMDLKVRTPEEKKRRVQPYHTKGCPNGTGFYSEETGCEFCDD